MTIRSIPALAKWAKELDYDGPTYTLWLTDRDAYTIARNVSRTGWNLETNVGGRHTYVTPDGGSHARPVTHKTAAMAVTAARRHYVGDGARTNPRVVPAMRRSKHSTIPRPAAGPAAEAGTRYSDELVYYHQLPSVAQHEHAWAADRDEEQFVRLNGVDDDYMPLESFDRLPRGVSPAGHRANGFAPTSAFDGYAINLGRRGYEVWREWW